MRFVALSDHAGDMLADARRRRASARKQLAEIEHLGERDHRFHAAGRRG
jgi:hypothetical protein